MRPALEKACAVALGAAIFFVGAEVAARAVFRHILQYDVEMWRYAKALKQPGRIPGLRFEHRPDAVARLMGVEVRTNADGMRDRDYPHEPSPQALRIAVLGDSITLGWGVRQEEAYTKVLERLLTPLLPERRVEVLNFGVGNYNTADEYAMLRGRALAYAPNAIVVGTYLNDAEPSDLREPSWLLEHSVFAVWLWGRVDALMRRAGLRESYADYFRRLHRQGQPGRAGMEDALGGILAVGRAKGIPVAVAMLPDLHRQDDYPFREIHETLRRAVVKGAGYFVDLLPAVPAGAGERFWVSADDPHPNAAVHALYAHALRDALPWTEMLEARAARAQEAWRGED